MILTIEDEILPKLTQFKNLELELSKTKPKFGDAEIIEKKKRYNQVENELLSINIGDYLKIISNLTLSYMHQIEDKKQATFNLGYERAENLHQKKLKEFKNDLVEYIYDNYIKNNIQFKDKDELKSELDFVFAWHI